MRNAGIERKTAETGICLALELDGTGRSEISSGVGFLDHMLTLFSKHSRFDLRLSCEGDTYVDDQGGNKTLRQHHPADGRDAHPLRRGYLRKGRAEI